MKIKILHILGGMGRGGAPSFIINNMLKTDNNHVQYDFLVRKDNCAFNEVILKHGGNVYIVPEFPKKFISNYFKTKKFFVEHKGEYAAVHIHANALLYMLPIRLAIKKWGCKVIIHSHNTQSNVHGAALIHKINRRFFLPASCIRLACGQKAGRWMYGDKTFTVINNAVDTSLFRYDENKRKQIRDEFQIPENSIIIGNIGRFEIVKNHAFMLDVFKEFLSYNKNTFLFLVGDGSQKKVIETKTKQLGIDRNVVFTGVRSDTYNFYSAFDYYLMPSIYEGLPFTLIEAQAAGVPCLISENITQEVDLTNLIHRMTLNEEASMWASALISLNREKSSRASYAKEIIDAAYDTTVTARLLEKIYTGEM